MVTACRWFNFDLFLRACPMPNSLDFTTLAQNLQYCIIITEAKMATANHLFTFDLPLRACPLPDSLAFMALFGAGLAQLYYNK